MDLKAKFMLKNYKELIENRAFDEFDILGFLIFIRSFIYKNSKYKLIEEFADLVAHRERNQGMAMKCIANAIDNKYLCKANSKEIEGYNGIDEDEWKNQWYNLGSQFQITINDDIIKEITLCIYSLAQKTVYDDKKRHNGTIEFGADSRTGEIALLTTEGRKDSLYICFAKYGGYNVDFKYEVLPIKMIIHTDRSSGKLELRDDYNNLIVSV